ncbi:MAG: hypothetical protein WC222_08310, partial [Parachlamydiales bacterium]
MSCSVQHVTASGPLDNSISFSHSSPRMIEPHPDEDFFLPLETPLDKERHAAFVAKIIDACCVLNPAIAIDRETVLRCLNACV